MTLRTSLPFASLALLVAGCSGNVTGETGATTSGTGTSSGTTTTSSTTTSSTTTSSTTTSSGSTGTFCVTGPISLVVDNGAPETLQYACASAWNPMKAREGDGPDLRRPDDDGQAGDDRLCPSPRRRCAEARAGERGQAGGEEEAVTRLPPRPSYSITSQRTSASSVSPAPPT